ncbi:hypothetical protein D3C72_1428150 [compost metagenome]
MSQVRAPAVQVAPGPRQALPVVAAQVVVQRLLVPVSVSVWPPAWAWEPASVEVVSPPVRLPREEAAPPQAGQVAVAAARPPVTPDARTRWSSAESPVARWAARWSVAD